MGRAGLNLHTLVSKDRRLRNVPCPKGGTPVSDSLSSAPTARPTCLALSGEVRLDLLPGVCHSLAMWLWAGNFITWTEASSSINEIFFQDLLQICFQVN